MWFLTELATSKRFYLLQNKSRYLVSRNADSGDLILTGDTSISRSHASLHPERDHVKLIDIGSKYGTFVNENIDSNVPLEKHVSLELRLNDRIRFGRLLNVWRLDKLDVVSFSSTLSVDEKKSLKNDLCTLNGSLLSEWSERCTHLTVCTITITLKVLQALSGTIPIVTPEFWKAFIVAAQSGRELPNPVDFVPPINEPFISNDVSFAVNVERRRIFAKTEFIFMQTKAMERYELIIKLAGGKCVSMEQKKLKKSTLVKPGVCVVLYNPSTQSQTSQDVGTIAEHLQTLDRRTVPEWEIGLAILHCSTNKFCNPLFRPDEDFQMPSLKRTASAVLADNTPPVVEMKKSTNVEVVVPETLVEESEAKPSMSMEPIVLLDESMEVFSEKKTLNIPIDTKNSGSSKSLKRYGSPLNSVDHLPKRAATNVDDNFHNISVQMLDEDNDLIDSISFDLDEVESSCGRVKTVSEKAIDRSNTSETAATENESLPLSNTQHTIASTSGFISRKVVQPPIRKSITTRADQPQKRKFNLLSNDSDDDEDDALFKFDKNPIQIKKNKTTTSGPVTTSTDDNNDSELFAFASTASQKLVSQKKQSKAVHTLQANTSRPNSYMSRTIQSMHNLSIQPVSITLTGWLCSTSIKSENDFLEPKTETDLDGSIDDKSDSKEWIKQIKNAFEVRVKKMQLVNRSHLDRTISSTGSDRFIGDGSKNFKAFVKKHNFHAQSTILKTIPSASSGPKDFTI